jgi:lipopolysaccharide transport system permease protein
MWRYRDLLYFLVWRDIKVRYAQSVLGIAWGIIQPVAFMVVFTIFFGNLAKISSDGVPYAIFSYTALVPWTYFSTALANATGSLVSNRNMVTRIYLPRIFLPTSAILGRLVDFGIALILLFVLMAWFRTVPTIWILALPWLIFLILLTAVGLGLWLAALAVQYRDIVYAMNFVIQLLMYAAPVVYPASLIPDRYRILYALNPMVGVIEGFRSALLGTNPMPWDLLAVGSITAILVTLVGIFYFRRMELTFADVV